MAGFLSAAELAAMRAIAPGVLPNTCVISTASWASDGMGGGTTTWAVLAGGTASCKLVAKSSGAPDQTGGVITYHTDWLLHMAWNGTILPGYRVAVNSDNYQVVSVEDDHSWRFLKNAMLKRVE